MYCVTQHENARTWMVRNPKKNVRTPIEIEDDNRSTLSPFYSGRAIGEKAGYKLGDWQIK